MAGLLYDRRPTVLLSHRHHFIYTKTLKTAGTSVEIYFEDACLPSADTVIRGHQTGETITSAGVIGYRGADHAGCTWYNHMPARAIRDLVGPDTWNSYYKFCVVRDPFDKLVSLWWFNNVREGRRYENEDFAQIRTDFLAWCAGHLQHAIDRDKYLIDGVVSMDHFIRYESLLDGVEHVCRQVGYPFHPEALGRFKAESRLRAQPCGEYYDAPAITAMETAFHWELDYFGYSRPSRTLI
jgi:Sulfotransferase family